MKTSWTKSLPSESGFYWYRNDIYLEATIVHFDAEEQILAFIGSDLGAGGYWSEPINGEFYSERIEPPI